MIIKYEPEEVPEVVIKQAKGIGGDDYDYDYIYSITETSDGGYIAGGYFQSESVDLGNGVTLTNNGGYDGIIIKYDANGVVQWAKGIGGDDYDYIYSVASTSDGGYIAGGYFQSESVDLGNGVTLTNNGGYDGIIIKYDANGVVQWAKGIGGDDYDYIYSVASTSDGGYIAGNTRSSVVDLGNGDNIN